MNYNHQNITSQIQEQIQYLGGWDKYVNKFIAKQVAQQMKNINKKSKKQHQKKIIENNSTFLSTVKLDPFESAKQYDFDLYQNSRYNRFKKLGQGPKGQPIFRLTDFYLPHDQIIKKIFQSKINKYVKTDFRKKKQQDDDNLYEILNKWIDNLNSGNVINQKESKYVSEQDLQNIVNEIGQSKKNFFLHYKSNLQNQLNYQDVEKNNPMNSAYFIPNLKNSLNRKMDLKGLNQFNQNEQKVDDNKQKNKDEILLQLQYKKKNQCWGCFDDFNYEQQVEEEIDDRLVKNIIREFSYYNQDLLNGSWKLPVKQLNRIQIDLNCTNYFLTKVNTILKQKEKNQNLIKQLNQKTQIKKKEKDQDHLKRDLSDIYDTSKLSANDGTMISAAIKSQAVPQLSINILLQTLLNSQKKSQLQYKHSPLAQKLYFNKFRMENREFRNYHRHYFRMHQERKFIKLVPHLTRKRPYILKLNTEVIQSYHKFEKPQSLSCKDGTFVLCQHIESNPLLLTNPGMCSKMMIYVDNQRMTNHVINKAMHLKGLDQLDQKKGVDLVTGQQGAALWRKQLNKEFGPLGGLWLQQNGATSLMGETDGLGALVIQNKVEGHPAVRHQPRNTDFLLVRDEKGKYYLRKIEHLYLSGQIEPRMEIYNPDSRSINSFLLDYLKSYIKLQFKRKDNVSFDELKQIFKHFTQTNIRKTLASLETISTDNRNFVISDKKICQNLDVTPEQVCLYQKMQNTLYHLKQFGLQQLRSPQKIKSVTNTYFKRNPKDLKKFTISKLIAEQLFLCPWYLSSSYLTCLNSGKLQLTGHGDPTNGHGGISFIKKPLKKRLDKDEEPDEDRNKVVTGTQADLRKLKNEHVSELLLQRGVPQYEVNKMNRWQKVDYLKDIAPNEQLLSKFVREQRATKKMQKQKYQKDINKLFNTLLKNISITQVCDLDEVNIEQPLEYCLEYYMARQKETWQSKKNRLKVLKIQKTQQFD